MFYKIGQIAKQTGVTTRTLRYYEQIGLLKPSITSKNGYRFYLEATVAIVNRIRELQHVGLSLMEIKEVIGLYFEQNRRVEAKKKTLKFLQLHLEDVDEKIVLLRTIKSELQDQIKITQSRLAQLTRKGK